MATHIHRGPSNVVEFPAVRRAILGGVSGADQPQKPDGDVSTARFVKAAFGDGWYHEAALRDADPERKQ